MPISSQSKGLFKKSSLHAELASYVLAWTAGVLMKSRRVWIETLALGVVVGCACALLIAMLAAGTAAFTSPASAETTQNASSEPASAPATANLQTFEGMVTCSRCGAKHSAALGRTAADCTVACQRVGGSFALIDGDNTYTLQGDLNALKRSAGQRARVTGDLHGNTIAVASIATAN
jgi:hypothetical protein